MERKSTIEEALQAQFAILQTHNATMDTPLVDSEGFPRSDIDVFAVRHARVRIIELRNDLKATYDDIAAALQDGGLADASSSSAPATNGVANSQAPMVNGIHDTVEDQSATPQIPFGKVNGVAPGSPAAQAVSVCHLVSLRKLMLRNLGAPKRRPTSQIWGNDCRRIGRVAPASFAAGSK